MNRENQKTLLHRLAAVIAILLSTVLPTFVHAASPKLGWAGSSADDHNASNASWYYRWWHNKPADAAGTLADFVPLIKYPNNLQNKLDIVAAYDDVDTLLVLNEPERASQSDVSVQDALNLWPTVQEALPNHTLVSPGTSDDAAGIGWLTSFMDEVDSRNANANPADDLRVDAVAFHWYGASSPNAVNAANNFLSRVDWYHSRFNRPLWITEFAMHDWEGNDPTEAMIQANADFLEIVIPALESRSYVDRYSYYNWFDDARVFQEPNQMPTPIGDQYVGTVLTGETRDLAGVSLGTDIVYLRGGTLTNTGAAIPEAMRSIDALGGVSTIAAAAEWSLSTRRDAYVRIRDGATLRKNGQALVQLTGAISNRGTLHVEEGPLRLQDGSYSGGGAIQVDQGTTLQLDVQDGRGIYSIGNTRLVVSGRVEGPLRLTSGSVLTPMGPAAEFSDDLALRDSVLEVGGPGFSAGAPAVLPIAAGLNLEYNASRDQPGDSLWSEATGVPESFTFGGPATPIAVQDSAWPGVTAAYPISSTGGATGLNQYFEAGAPRSRQDATFEIVFRVNDTNAGTDQVLLEVGGAGRGVAFVLNQDTLTFNVDGDGADIDLTHTLGTGWNQAVGVIDLTGGTDSVTLYVNGQQVATLDGQNINDWAGGNLAGLGGGASSATGVANSPGGLFHGDLAVARYYEGVAFGETEALQNFQALTLPLTLEPGRLLVEGDLLAEAGSELRLDVSPGGTADKIFVNGVINLTGATLSVDKVGEEQFLAGEAFDLFDAGSTIGDFDSINLPALSEGLRWRSDELRTDGTLRVVLAGDLNADGSVDAADYTIWRDSQGQLVSAYSLGDSNGDGSVDASDLAEWRSNFGANLASASFTVPEPAVHFLLTCVLPFFPRGVAR